MTDDTVSRQVRFPRELFERIEAARGKIPRESWIRDACELALAGLPPGPQPGPNVERIRSSAQAKRNVRPIPKGGGR